MGKKKLIYLLFLGIITFLLASSFISAELFQYKANVRISAGADQNLVVRFEDTSTKKILQSIRETTDSAGYATIEFETNSEEINVIIVFVKNLSQYLEDSNVIRTEVAGPYSTDGRIVIDVGQLIAEKNKKESENITTNETIENTSTDEITPPPETEEITTEEDNQENKEGATGSVISDEEGGIFSNKTFYYIIFGILLLVIAFVIIRLITGRIAKTKQIRVTKLSELRNDKKAEKIKGYEEIISIAEKEIAEAKRELDKLQEKDEIRDAKERLERNKERLAQLREGKERLLERLKQESQPKDNYSSENYNSGNYSSEKKFNQ